MELISLPPPASKTAVACFKEHSCSNGRVNNNNQQLPAKVTTKPLCRQSLGDA